MSDETEGIRRALVAVINSEPNPRAELEAEYGTGNVWNTDELREAFEVIGFMAPFCVVKRRDNGVKGSVMFQHSPRFYFGWQAE